MGVNIIGHEVKPLQGLGECLVLTFEDESTHIMPLEAIASWGELLGMEDVGEIVSAMIHVRENGEPEPDPVTGENAWTAAYEALMLREQVNVREQYAAVASGRGGDPRSPRLRGAVAASTVTGQVTLGRDQTRAMLALPPVDVPLTLRAAPSMLDGLKQELATYDNNIETARAGFLAELRPPLPTEKEQQ